MPVRPRLIHRLEVGIKKFITDPERQRMDPYFKIPLEKVDDRYEKDILWIRAQPKFSEWRKFVKVPGGWDDTTVGHFVVYVKDLERYNIVKGDKIVKIRDRRREFETALYILEIIPMTLYTQYEFAKILFETREVKK